jgi:hypothetical protein
MTVRDTIARSLRVLRKGDAMADTMMEAEERAHDLARSGSLPDGACAGRRNTCRIGSVLLGRSACNVWPPARPYCTGV